AMPAGGVNVLLPEMWPRKSRRVFARLVRIVGARIDGSWDVSAWPPCASMGIVAETPRYASKAPTAALVLLLRLKRVARWLGACSELIVGRLAGGVTVVVGADKRPPRGRRYRRIAAEIDRGQEQISGGDTTWLAQHHP